MSILICILLLLKVFYVPVLNWDYLCVSFSVITTRFQNLTHDFMFSLKLAPFETGSQNMTVSEVKLYINSFACWGANTEKYAVCFRAGAIQALMEISDYAGKAKKVSNSASNFTP